MRSHSTILIVFLFLALTAAYFLLTDPWSTTGGGLSGLLPDAPGDVRAIRLIDRYDTLEFVRRDAGWYLQDEQMEQKAVDNLLYAAERMTIRSIVDLTDEDGGVRFIEVVYMGKRGVEGHFLLVSTATGLLVSPSGSTRAYGVELKGFEDLSLEKIFSMNPDHYRKHLIVDLLPSEVSVVKVDPLHGTSFMAVQDNEGTLVVTELGSGEDVTGSVSENKVRMLFSYFNAIRYDETVAKDSIANGALQDGPMAVVEVQSADGGVDGPGYLLVNYYYLDLLMRGLERYGYGSAVDTQ